MRSCGTSWKPTCVCDPTLAMCKVCAHACFARVCGTQLNECHTGMSFMAAVLLLNMDCYTSFQCLANMLNRKIFLEFFRMNMIQIRKYMLVLEELMAKHLPRMAAHFEALRLTPDMYIVDWVLTLFSKALPLDLAMRVWVRWRGFVWACSNAEQPLTRSSCVGLLLL